MTRSPFSPSRPRAAVLESLQRSNLFVVPLDGTGEWYRYHRLFQELLRSELARTDPELPGRLLTRATDWCVANGQAETAIGYAQQAGDVDRVAQLVQLCAQLAYQSGRVATVEGWIECGSSSPPTPFDHDRVSS